MSVLRWEVIGIDAEVIDMSDPVPYPDENRG
jgi:hypothetical protein